MDIGQEGKEMTLFINLFCTFFIIGLFTIGGGYAMLPLIHRKVVIDNSWISDQLFTDIVAISQMTPGPIGINSATYIGYSVIKEAGYNWFLCVCGSFTTTIAVVLPSFIIVLALCHVYGKFNKSAIFTGLMSGLKPTVTGLIAAAAILLITPDNFPDWKSWIIFALSFIAAFLFKINPILILIGAGVAGYLIY